MYKEIQAQFPTIRLRHSKVFFGCSRSISAVATGEGKHLSPHKEVGCVSCTFGNACVCSMLPTEMTERCLAKLEFMIKGSNIREASGLYVSWLKHDLVLICIFGSSSAINWKSFGRAVSWPAKVEFKESMLRLVQLLKPGNWSISCWSILPLSLTQLL